MLVAKFKNGPGFGKRWAIVAWSWGLFLENQVMEQPDGTGIEKWRPCGDYFGFGFRRDFRLAIDHQWYDGPNCAWNLGWFYITWNMWDCKKCNNDCTG